MAGVSAADTGSSEMVYGVSKACAAGTSGNHAASPADNTGGRQADTAGNPADISGGRQADARGAASARIAAVIVSAVLWASYGTFVNIITGMGMSQRPLIFLRLLVTMAAVLGFILAKDRSLLKTKLKDIWLFAANGFASIVFFSMCYTAAIRETKIATAAALLYTAPVFVLLISAAVFKEKLTARKLICAAGSVTGCALVSGLAGGIEISAAGLLLGLGAGFGYGLYSIFSRMIQNRGYSIYTNIFYTFLFASAAYFVLCGADGSLAEVAANPAASAVGVLNGVVTGFSAYMLYTWGLAGMEPSRAAQLATIEPVAAAVLGVVIFGQNLSFWEIIGMALVVISVIAMNISKARAS